MRCAQQDNINETFAEFKATGDVTLRNRIAEHHLPLVKAIADALIWRLPAGVDVGDLIQAGSMGLLNAIASFDPARAVKFSTFAQRRIFGAMIDHLRSMDGASRLVRDRAKKIGEAVAQLEVELGRPPSPDELQNRLGVTSEKFALMQATNARPIARPITSLSQPKRRGEDDHHPSAPIHDLQDHRESQPGRHVESKDAFDSIIRIVLNHYTLTDAVLLKLCVEGWTLQAIATLLGNLTESSMCQRRTKLFKQLRARRDLADLGLAVREAA